MKKFQGRVNDLGWEIYPEGLYEILTSLKKWKKPIFITENGIADKSDNLRARFIIDHMKQVRRCLDEKVDVMAFIGHSWTITSGMKVIIPKEDLGYTLLIVV